MKVKSPRNSQQGFLSQPRSQAQCLPHSNWQYVSCFLKTFFLEEKKKMPNNEGKKKKSNIWTPQSPYPSTTENILFSPWNNYKGTSQANTECKWSLTCQPCPSSFICNSQSKIHSLMAFLYINTVEKKEVWNLNIMGPNSVFGPLGVQKVLASTGNRGPFSPQSDTLPVSYSPGKKVCSYLT